MGVLDEDEQGPVDEGVVELDEEIRGAVPAELRRDGGALGRVGELEIRQRRQQRCERCRVRTEPGDEIGQLFGGELRVVGGDAEQPAQ